MIVTTGNEIAGSSIANYLGIVRGIVVRSPSISQGFFGGLQQMVGGNIEAYAEVCEAARDEAFKRMVDHETSCRLLAPQLVNSESLVQHILANSKPADLKECGNSRQSGRHCPVQVKYNPMKLDDFVIQGYEAAEPEPMEVFGLVVFLPCGGLMGLTVVFLFWYYIGQAFFSVLAGIELPESSIVNKIIRYLSVTSSPTKPE